MELTQVLIAVSAGLASGFINAVAGGGSLVLFPAMLACGLNSLQANVTCSLANWPGYLGGVLGFRSELVGQKHRLPPLILFTLLGSSLGCALLLRLPVSTFDVVVPILVLFASLMLALQPRLKRWAGGSGQTRWGILSVGVFCSAIYGGYFGGALGVILLGTLALGLGDTLRRLNALKVVLTLVNGTVSLVAFTLFGPVHWGLALLAAPATLMGGYLGARLATRIPDRPLRVGIVLFSIVVAGYLFWRL